MKDNGRMREFLSREVPHRRSLKDDRLLAVDSAFARQGWRGCSRPMIIVVERSVHELECWDIGLYKCECKLNHWKLIAKVYICLIETKSLFSSP